MLDVGFLCIRAQNGPRPNISAAIRHSICCDNDDHQVSYAYEARIQYYFG